MIQEIKRLDQKLKRAILGLIIAPIVGLMMIILLLACEWTIGIVFNLETMNTPFLSTMLGMFITIGIPGVYIIACFTGIPTFYALTKLKLTQWYVYLFSGLIWGVLFFCVVDILILRHFPLKGLICLFFSNELIFGVSSLSYWLIAIKGN